MVEAIIKTMQLEDLPDVMDIENHIHIFPWTLKNFSDAMACGYRCMCLWLDGHIAGYSVLMSVIDEYHLLNISIAANWQGMGWGQYFLSWAQADAYAAGCQGFLLEVRPSNHPALQLYKKNNFEVIGVRRNYYPGVLGREDAMVMFKVIFPQPDPTNTKASHDT